MSTSIISYPAVRRASGVESVTYCGRLVSAKLKASLEFLVIWVDFESPGMRHGMKVPFVLEAKTELAAGAIVAEGAGKVLIVKTVVDKLDHLRVRIRAVLYGHQYCVIEVATTYHVLDLKAYVPCVGIVTVV